MSVPLGILLEGDLFATGSQWSRTKAPECVCVCPAPALRVGFSSRFRSLENPFGPWSDFDFGALGEYVGGIYAASNSNPELGGSETQVRCRFEITGNGRAGVVRFRQVFAEDVGVSTTQTVLTPGALQTIDIPKETSTLTVDFDFVPCAVGQTSFLVGPPGGGTTGDFTVERQWAFLRKRGFRQFHGDSPAVVIHRQEVAAGGDPGCDGSGRPARAYSGQQSFTATTASSGNNWLADPAGTYASTLSAHMVADGHASRPVDVPGAAVEFGTVTYPSETAKQMVEHYDCAGPVAKTLLLTLADEYPTAEMVDAVEAALELQLAHGGGSTPPDPRVVHRHWLAPGEVQYERVCTTQLRLYPTTPFDGVLGGPGELVTLAATAEVVTRLLGTGGTATVSELPFSFRVQANDDEFAGAYRSALETPDAPSPPLENVWEDEEHEQTEVLIRKVRIKPNALLVHFIPFVEDPGVVALGVD